MSNISLTAEQLISSWQDHANELLKQNVILKAMVEKANTQQEQMKEEITKYINENSLLKDKIKYLEDTPELDLVPCNNGHSKIHPHLLMPSVAK